MAQISTFLYSVTAIVIAASFINILLPKGEVKKHVKFVVGLIIICCFVSLISGLDEINIEGFADENSKEYSGQDYTAQLKGIFISKLKQEVANRFGVEDLEISVNDSMEITGIETQSNQKEEIEKYLGIR